MSDNIKIFVSRELYYGVNQESPRKSAAEKRAEGEMVHTLQEKLKCEGYKVVNPLLYVTRVQEEAEKRRCKIKLSPLKYVLYFEGENFLQAVMVGEK